MKITVLRTYTDDMTRIWGSLEADGHDVSTIKYDEYDQIRFDDMIQRVRADNPVLIVFIGALEEFHRRPVPNVDVLKRIHEIAPMVHLCPDSVEDVWQPVLENYAAAGCFDLQVGLDGWKQSSLVLPMLCPVDFRLFKNPIPWTQRTIDFGFVGSYIGTFATTILRYGSAHHNARWLKEGTYEEIAAFLGNCKFVVNSAWDSTETKGHVKPLVSDVAAAGACLIESMNDTTAEWFDRKTDYYEYQDFKAVANIMKMEIGSERPAAKAYAMHKKWNSSYGPDFWGDIFAHVFGGVAIEDLEELV